MTVSDKTAPVDPDSGWRVWGQPSAVSTLRRAVQSGPGHAYVFTGQAGVGKRLAAIEFARSLCCPNASETAAPCDACSSCRRIARGVYPDVSVFDLAGQAERERDKSRNTTLNISTVREVSAAVSYRPLESPWRIAIVDDVETMQETAQEAFLKTLEEPPPYAVIVLISSDADLLLPTILSRCTVVRFGLSNAESIVKRLDFESLSKDDVSEIAGLAEGVMGWALRASADRDLLGERRALVNEASAMVRGNEQQRSIQAFRLAEDFATNRELVLARLQVMQGLWRSLLLEREGATTSSPVQGQISEFSHTRSEVLIQAVRSVDECVANLETNVRPRLALLTMVTAWPLAERDG